jgi:hypothetical protein
MVHSDTTSTTILRMLISLNFLGGRNTTEAATSPQAPGDPNSRLLLSI